MADSLQMTTSAEAHSEAPATHQTAAKGEFTAYPGGLPNYANNLRYTGIEGIAFKFAEVKARNNTPDPAAEHTLNRPIEAKPFASLPESWNRTTPMDPYIHTARKWLTTCLANHDECSKNPRFCRIYGGGSTHQVIHLDHDTAMPSRLLQISDTDVRLVEVSQRYIEYVALSHCWGKSHTRTTTTDNYRRLLHFTGIAVGVVSYYVT